MKTFLLDALIIGSLIIPFTNAEAYSKDSSSNTQSSVISSTERDKSFNTDNENLSEEKVLARKYRKKNLANAGLSSTATARTDRTLISQQAPDNVVRSFDGVDEMVDTIPSVNAYTMRGGDQLQLIVYGHDDISTKLGTAYTPYVVRPDGHLTLPLIGEVFCSGKTVQQVTTEVTKRLAEYIIDPQVTINVTKLGTTRVYVLGEVHKQGTCELDKSHNLIDAVGAAGGFTAKAAKRSVYLVRQGMSRFAVKVNMLDLIKNGDNNSNPNLEEGDMIYISSNHKLKVSEVFGFFTAANNAIEARNFIRKE